MFLFLFLIISIFKNGVKKSGWKKDLIVSVTFGWGYIYSTWKYPQNLYTALLVLGEVRLLGGNFQIKNQTQFE